MTTDKLITTIYDLTTGKVVMRELNADEIAQYKKDEQDYEAQKAIIIKQNATRQAVLDKLGLTADEAALLLG